MHNQKNIIRSVLTYVHISIEVLVMNKVLVFGCAALLVFIAGCTTTSPPVSTPLPTVTTPPDPILPMDAQVVLGTGNTSFTAYIDSFEIDPPSEPGTQSITIYVAVKNTGTEPVQLVWFSRLTDVSGKIHGGIGISHGGTGARSGLITPNGTEAARDYIVVPEADFDILSQGAILDVYFIEKKSDKPTLVPDYHIRWTVDPGVLA
jgi:hypothetical protein